MATGNSGCFRARSDAPWALSHSLWPGLSVSALPQSPGATSLKFYLFFLLLPRKASLTPQGLARCPASVFHYNLHFPHHNIGIAPSVFPWAPPHPQLNYKILKSSDHVFSVQQDSDKFTKTKTGLLVPQCIAQHRNSMIMNERTNRTNFRST